MDIHDGNLGNSFHDTGRLLQRVIQSVGILVVGIQAPAISTSCKNMTIKSQCTKHCTSTVLEYSIMQSAVGCNVQALIHRRLVGCGTVRLLTVLCFLSSVSIAPLL